VVVQEERTIFLVVVILFIVLQVEVHLGVQVALALVVILMELADKVVQVLTIIQQTEHTQLQVPIHQGKILQQVKMELMAVQVEVVQVQNKCLIQLALATLL
jgi:hypothetical protein